jgi:hypothetical protein
MCWTFSRVKFCDAVLETSLPVLVRILPLLFKKQDIQADLEHNAVAHHIRRHQGPFAEHTLKPIPGGL